MFVFSFWELSSVHIVYVSLIDKQTFSSFIRLMVRSSEKNSAFTSVLPCRKSLLEKGRESLNNLRETLSMNETSEEINHIILYF